MDSIALALSAAVLVLDGRYPVSQNHSVLNAMFHPAHRKKYHRVVLRGASTMRSTSTLRVAD